MSGAIPPLPQYAFMEWCSLKKGRELYQNILYLRGTGVRILVKGCRDTLRSVYTRFVIFLAFCGLPKKELNDNIVES
jgi:hypothetical protein